MSERAVFDAVRSRFNTQVTVPQSLANVVHDNAPAPDVSERWYRLTMLVDSEEQQTAGGPGARRFRMSGRAVVQLFEPIGQADGSQVSLVDAIKTAFRGAAIASPSISFYPPPSSDGSVAAADGWFERSVQIYFDADYFA